MTAARKIFSELDPRADPPGGVAGSTLGLSPEQAGDTAHISLDGYGQTALDPLNHVVIESPRAWYVVISDGPGPVRAVRFGFIQTQGITIGVDLAGNNVTVR